MLFAVLYVEGIILIFNVILLLFLSKKYHADREIIVVLVFADLFALLVSAVYMFKVLGFGVM